MSERFGAEQIKQHWPAADHAAIDILSRKLALKAVLADLIDAHKGLPVGDAKKDGLLYVIGNLNKHLARLGADPGREGGEGV